MNKILIIAKFPIYANKGGVQRVTHVLSSEFLKKGAEVTYLALEVGVKELIDGVAQLYLPSNKKHSSYDNIKYTQQLIKDRNINIIINQAGIYEHVTDFLTAIKTSHLKIFTVHHNCIACLHKNYRNIILGNLKNKTLQKLIDNPIVWYILKKKNKLKYGSLFKNTIKVSDKLVLLSKYFIPELKYYLPKFNAGNVISIVNPASFKPVKVIANKENRLLYVGRLSTTQKRVERLVKIWEVISEKFPNWEFDIVGDGPAKEQLQEEVKRKEIERIYFHGFQDPKPFLEKAKVFTLTSDFEGFGMVLVEAQIFGVVPISYNCFSAIQDIIVHKHTGVIIKGFNQEKYIKEVQFLMEDSTTLKKMSKAAIEHVQSFDAEVIAKQWLKLFKA